MNEPRPAHGRFAVNVRLEGDYCLPFPNSYPGGAEQYIDDLAGYAVDAFLSHLLYGTVGTQRVRVTQEVEYDQVPGAIA